MRSAGTCNNKTDAQAAVFGTEMEKFRAWVRTRLSDRYVDETKNRWFLFNNSKTEQLWCVTKGRLTNEMSTLRLYGK